MRNGRKGNSLLEFTLAGIPLIFVLISIFEIARGMWIYTTLAYAVKEATRLAIVKGRGYVYAQLTNTPVPVSRIVQEIRIAGVGLDPNELNVTLTSEGGSINCNPITACAGNATQWPPVFQNGRNRPVSIEAVFPFRSALAMFWPGGGPGLVFGVVWMRARSQDMIQF